MAPEVTVAIPTLNAGLRFADTLAAVCAQELDREVELLICDSGSADGTVALAREHGARVIGIPPTEFSHGGTRNLLMASTAARHVAFLTQDAVPADRNWLAALLSGFDAAPDVGLAFGPYRAPSGTSVSVAREIDAWFSSFSDGGVRVDVLPVGQRDRPARNLMGRVGFFTDANGCVARSTWERVPFRSVAYAEDHLLAHDMLRAGFAKVFVPDAAVLHAHDYSVRDWLRRSFDEARAVREVYEFSAGSRTLLRNLRGSVKADLDVVREQAYDPPAVPVTAFTAAVAHHGARAVGALLAGHADHIPAPVLRRLSLEGRA